MQDDKNLKALLQQWSMQQPSADFTNVVMQRITAAYTFKSYITPLLKQKLPLVLLGVFILVCIALFALSFTVPAIAFPLQWNIQVSAKIFSQSLSFLLVFWVVTGCNMAAKKYAAKMV